MLKLYDTVKIKATGKLASIVEIGDNGGKDVTIYLVELHDKPENAPVTEVVKWLEAAKLKP